MAVTRPAEGTRGTVEASPHVSKILIWFIVDRSCPTIPSNEHVHPLTHVLSCDNGVGPISVHVPTSVRKSPAVKQEVDARAAVVFVGVVVVKVVLTVVCVFVMVTVEDSTWVRVLVSVVLVIEVLDASVVDAKVVDVIVKEFVVALTDVIVALMVEIVAVTVEVTVSVVCVTVVTFEMKFRSIFSVLAHQQSLYWPPGAVRGVLPHSARAPLAPIVSDRPERVMRAKMLSDCPHVSNRR
jgi:hypothetical protein